MLLRTPWRGDDWFVLEDFLAGFAAVGVGQVLERGRAVAGAIFGRERKVRESVVHRRGEGPPRRRIGSRRGGGSHRISGG